MGLEELLTDAGGFGRFQLVDLLIMSLGRLFGGWSMFQMTFAGIVPDFLCEEVKTDVAFDELPVNMTVNTCSVPLNTSNPSLGTTECVSFNYTSPYKTVIKDFDLVCGREWITRTLTSIQMAGLMLGCILSGQMGDVLGRWWCNFIFVTVHSLANIAAAFAPGWEVFAACRFAIGLGLGGTLVVCFIHPMEFMTKKWRPTISCIPVWITGIAILSLSAYLLQDWRKMHFVCGVCGLIELPLLFLLPESVRWLATQGKIDQAVAAMDKVARWNGRPPLPHARASLEEVYNEQKKSQEGGKRYTYMAIMKPWPITKITLITCYKWFSYSLAYYGISFGVSDLAGNFFINLLLLAVIDAPFQIINLYSLNKIGRKWTAFPVIMVAVGCSLACMVLQITGSDGKKSITITALSLTSKTAVLIAWNVLQTWGNELYPTVIRNLGYGAGNTSARIAGILAPLVINFDTRMTESYVLIVVLLAVNPVLILMLPDTKGQTLPDTISGDKTDNSTEGTPGSDAKVKRPEKVAYFNTALDIHEENGVRIVNGKDSWDDTSDGDHFTSIRL